MISLPNRIWFLIEILTVVVLATILISLEAFLNLIEDVDQILSFVIPSLISSSAIFAGLLATYLVTRISSVRSERLARLPEIDELSKKLTQLRKVLARFRSGFIRNSGEIRRLLYEHPEYTWENITTSMGYTGNVIQREFWNEPYSNEMALHLALDEIVNDHREPIGWAFSESDEIAMRYTYNEVVTAYYICNELWDFFDHNYHGYGIESRVNFSCHALRSPYWLAPLRANVSRINQKYSEMPIDRFFLSKLGSEFHDQYLPRLIKLVARNEEEVPSYLSLMSFNLLLIILGGVLIPLLMQLTVLNEQLIVILTSLSIGAVFAGFLFTSFSLLRAWKTEGNVSDY